MFALLAVTDGGASGVDVPTGVGFAGLSSASWRMAVWTPSDVDWPSAIDVSVVCLSGMDGCEISMSAFSHVRIILLVGLPAVVLFSTGVDALSFSWESAACNSSDEEQ